MRKSNLLFSAVMALAVGSLTGCSDHLAPDTPVQETVDHDQVRYLNVAIVSPKNAGSRTGDSDDTSDKFAAGDVDENTIHTMTFTFYDANGLPTGQAKTLTEEEINAGNLTDGTGSIGKIWKSTIPVALNQGENLPAYVLCFVNPVNPTGLAGKSLKEIEELTRGQVVLTVDGAKHFPMSNSMYYGTSPQGQSNVRLFATPISTNQLYPSEDAAARNQHVVDIYVERYASRMMLTMAPTAVSEANTTAVNGYKLEFVPEYWRPNAIDQNIYIIKRYGIVDGSDKNYEPTYAQLLTNFNNRTWWNDAPNYRSYWGCSPSYYTNEYPKVSDDITDVAPTNSYGNDRKGYPFDLHYFNYDQIKTGAVEGGNPLQPSVAWNTTSGFNQVFYARETTSAAKTWGYATDLNGYNPLTSLPSIVIVGHYKLTKTGGDTYTDVPNGQPSFYLYGKTNNKYNLYFESEIVGAMVKQQNVVLEKKTDGGVTSYSAYRTTANFKVEHPSKDVRAIKNTVVAGRHVALQLKSDNLPELYYYDVEQDENNRYVRIDADNINKVNSDLLSAGYATMYGDGIAYFNIPVEHLGIRDEAGNYLTDVKEKGNGNKYKFQNCPPGSFGIVRNHTYNIEITKISGLATALRSKTQPIVPPVEEISYEISANLNIQSWRIMPKQSVEL